MEKDILKSAAIAYQKLLSIEYRIVLGIKGKQKVLDIAFLPDNFYRHIMMRKMEGIFNDYWCDKK